MYGLHNVSDQFVDKRRPYSRVEVEMLKHTEYISHRQTSLMFVRVNALSREIFTGRNKVVAKVIFLHLFVILFTGGVLPQCMLGYHPREQTPPGDQTPRDQTPRTRPPDQTPAYGLRTAGTHPTGMHSRPHVQSSLTYGSQLHVELVIHSHKEISLTYKAHSWEKIGCPHVQNYPSKPPKRNSSLLDIFLYPLSVTCIKYQPRPNKQLIFR